MTENIKQFWEQNFNKDECTELIKEMATSQELVANIPWKCRHMSYLIVKGELPGSGIVSTLSCDLATISWKNLFSKADLDCLTLEAILSLGGSIILEEIKQYLTSIKDGSIEVLNFAIDKCSPSLNKTNLSELCKHALKLKRVSFVVMMITSREVVLDSAIVLQAFDYHQDLTMNIEILKLAMNKCIPPLSSANMNTLCENAVKHKKFELVAEIISLGATLDAAVILRECNISVIANNPIGLEVALNKCTPPLKKKDLDKLCENALKNKKLDLVIKLLSDYKAKLNEAIFVQKLSTNEVLNVIKNYPSLVDVNNLCIEAVKFKKIKMATELIDHGAVLDAKVVLKSFKLQDVISNKEIFTLVMERCNPQLDQENLNKLCESAARFQKLDLVTELISCGAKLDAAILTEKFSINFISDNLDVLNIASEKCIPPLNKETLNALFGDAAKSKKLDLLIELISRGVARLNIAIMVSTLNIEQMVYILNKATKKQPPILSNSDMDVLCKAAVKSKKMKLVSELFKRGATIDADNIIGTLGVQEIIANNDVLEVVLEKCNPPLNKENLNKLCQSAANYKKLDLVLKLMSVNGADVDPSVLMKNFTVDDIVCACTNVTLLKVIIKKFNPPLNNAQLNELCKSAAENRLITIVKELISQGAKLNAKAIVNSFTIEDIFAKDCEILNIARSMCVPHFSSSDLNMLCIKAAKSKKIDFVESLISQGAKLDASHIVGNFTEEEMLSDYRILRLAMKKCTPPLSKSAINLGFAITADIKLKDDWKTYISFLTELLEYGISPNRTVGDGGECLLDMALRFPENQKAEKIELLILLLKYGAAMKDCTYPQAKGTTLLHILTKLAITSGKPINPFFMQQGLLLCFILLHR